MIEQRDGSFRMGPRPTVQKGAELPTPPAVLELVIAEPPSDLPRVLIRRLRPLDVPLHTRRVADPQLLGQVLHHRPRHIQRVFQKQPEVAHCADLQSHAQPVTIGSPPRDQIMIIIVQEEETLQLRLGRHLPERPVRGGLLISQKTHRHDREP